VSRRAPESRAAGAATGTAAPRAFPRMEPVSSTFPRTRRSQRGYDVQQVDRFFTEARRAYDDAAETEQGLDAASIRHTAFRMRRGGYSPGHVDAALERLEDAFAERERDRGMAAMGEDAWLRRARELADEITARLERADGEKFRRVGRLTSGYDPDEVDRFGKRVLRYFREGRPMSVDEVRQATFRTSRGGYSEAQVDLLLDAVIDVMLAAR
jgi:DivIVA domain-containing protein